MSEEDSGSSCWTSITLSVLAFMGPGAEYRCLPGYSEAINTTACSCGSHIGHEYFAVKYDEIWNELVLFRVWCGGVNQYWPPLCLFLVLPLYCLPGLQVAYHQGGVLRGFRAFDGRS